LGLRGASVKNLIFRIKKENKLGFGLAKDVFGFGKSHEFANIVRIKEE
jgi:hypothetical protein